MAPRFGGTRGRGRCAPSPCAPSVKPRCGPRENSSRTKLLDGLVPGHGRTRGTAEHLVAQVPAVEELQEGLVVAAAAPEDDLLERGVAPLPRRRPTAEERLQ